MSDDAKAAAKRVRLDEKAKTLRRSWSQLPPVQKGWVRGRATTVSVDVVRTMMGLQTTQIFSIQETKDSQPVLVELRGLVIVPRLIRDKDLVEVFRGSSTEQPLKALRVFFPLNGTWVDAHDGPGETVRLHKMERVGSILMVVGPIVVISALIATMWFYWHLFD